MTFPFPLFYDAADHERLYIERADLIAETAQRDKERFGVAPATTDKFKVAVFGIDCQVGFCTPGASLFVPGAVDDTRRITEWLYRNLDKISGVHFSMDTHRVFQIFHPAFWLDKEGNHPAPLTPIFHDDVRAGNWIPLVHPRACLEYTKKLEEDGKYVLTIWPYHTLLGGISHALVPSLMEFSLYHAVVRMHQTHFETKGTHAMTENYSVLSPEVKDLEGQSVGQFNAPFFKMLMEYDRIYVFGQAKSHCVLSTLRDMQTHIAQTEPDLVKKVFIIEDAMSSVPAPNLDPLPASLDFPRLADEAISNFRKAGMNVVTTKEDIVF